MKGWIDVGREGDRDEKGRDSHREGQVCSLLGASQQVGRQTERQTDKQTDRHRLIDRQAGKHVCM